MLFGLVVVACAPAAAHATTAPVAAYGFEDAGDATIAGDSSVFGNTGIVVGGAARVAGKFGAALSFDGVDDLVRIADAGPLNLASGMTVEAWVAPTVTGGLRTVLVKGRGSDLSYALDAGTTPSGHVSTNGVTGFARAPDELVPDVWTHLAATYDGATLRFYVNGAKVAASTERSGPLTPGDGALTIGGNDVWGEWFSGRIDEVRVYDRALTADELAVDMATPVGNPVAGPPDPRRDQVGAWTAPVDWPLVAVHASMLSDGKVVAWDAFDAAVRSERIWDPETSSFVPIPSGINLFCAGHVLLPDGRLFVAGGHEKAYEGLRETRLLNPLAGSWTAGPNMSRARWYPTTTTLSDGRVLIVSGDAITTGGPNTPFIAPSDTLPEIYDPKTNILMSMPSAARRMPLYPFMFLAPDGRVVDAGPDTVTRILDTETGQWSTLGSRSPIDGHSAVMYRPGRILKSGTWTDTAFPIQVPVTNRAAVLDMTQPLPSWREVAPMKWARTFHTLTVLPDGDVLALAGQSLANANSLRDGPVLQPEIWHPATDTWTPVASSLRPRGYHNTSLLLPDGRILLAGSGRLDDSLMTDETTAEIFSPPYLHKGPRPTITSAPSAIEYGGRFEIETPDAARVDKVSLVRMGAVTHNFNMDQRWQELSFRRVAGKLEIDAPASGNLAPPGVYYVFILDEKGVPSKAAIVSIAADAVAPSVPDDVSAVGSREGISLSWKASTDNVAVSRYVVHRAAAAGFTPSASTRVAVTSGVSYTDRGLAAGTYHYRVIAEDEAGNASAPSAEASATMATSAPTAPATDKDVGTPETAASGRPAALPVPRKSPVKARGLPGGKVRLAVNGRLELPDAVARAAGCDGALTVTVTRGTRTIATARIKLSRDCRYTRTIVLSRSQTRQARRLRVTVTFRGNDRLAPAQRAYSVKVS